MSAVSCQLADIIDLEAAYGIVWPDDIVFPETIYRLSDHPNGLVELSWTVFVRDRRRMFVIRARPASMYIFQPDKGMLGLRSTPEEAFEFIRHSYPELVRAKMA
jgi:hypothetical protein